MRSMAELQKSFKASTLLSLVVLLLLFNITARPSMAAARILPVGVILDLNSPLGKMLNNSLTLAVEDYYSDHTDTANKINLNSPEYFSQRRRGCGSSRVRLETPFNMQAASDLIQNHKVRAILGPQNSEQARYIVELGEESKVPVIWFPITGPSLLPPPPPYSDEDLNCFQFQAIAALIKALGWQSIVPIYEDTEYGSQLILCLANVLKDMGIQMVNLTAIDSDLTDFQINSALDKLNGMRTHVFLVHMSMDIGTRFIVSTYQRDMMSEGYAWILTQELSSLTDPQVKIMRKLYRGSVLLQNFTDYVALKGYMQGALGVRPVDSNKIAPERRKIEENFTDTFHSRPTIYGWWAYHTIEALAMALEKPGTTDNSIKLLEEIQATNFTGVSGVHFYLRKGQLDQSELVVYNVVGNRERIIGHWSPETGLVQDYSKSGKTSGKYPLKDPLWPGDTLDKPQRSRIGLPTTNSFPEIVNVDHSNYEIRLDGFAIDVFFKAVNALPFPFNYVIVPLPNISMSGTPMTYDDILCKQIKEKDLDAVIGDITVVAIRTKCVDFTLPYLDSSVTMVVKVKTSTSKSILFKPFKWSLWLILGGIFVTATIIIIISERNKTEEFRFNPFLVYKIDITEKLASNAAGWMVILTSFLFILVVQVYTANLTSILTEGKMKGPSFKDENEIKSRNLSLGYRSGSWVRVFLIEQIGFKSDQLKALKSREEYNEALSIGTKRGGVDAIFDEIPYLTLFLSKCKSRYTMTGLIYKTGGYAFAFPKKSSMVSHYSQAILKVTQDVELYRALMAKNSLPTSFEDLEFEDQSDIEMTSLKIAYFGGLYPILASVLALFLGLAILNPSMIQWLHEKLSKLF